MTKIKHIAIATQNEKETADFYVNVLGLKKIGEVNLPSVCGYYLTDGSINVAVLRFKTDAAAGIERGKDWSGIHHLGFHVDSWEEMVAKLEAAGSVPRHDINKALFAGQDKAIQEQGLAEPEGDGELRYSGPDGVTFDVSEGGWPVTPIAK